MQMGELAQYKLEARTVIHMNPLANLVSFPLPQGGETNSKIKQHNREAYLEYGSLKAVRPQISGKLLRHGSSSRVRLSKA